MIRELVLAAVSALAIVDRVLASESPTCHPGTYRDSNYVDDTWIETCEPCLANEYSNVEDATYCEYCPYDSSSPMGSSFCVCKPGMYMMYDSLYDYWSCFGCPRNTYDAFGGTGIGVYNSVGQTKDSSSVCLACPGAPSHSSVCTPALIQCAAGDFYDAYTGVCQPCPGSSISDEGATKCHCPQGMYFMEATLEGVSYTDCHKCPYGTYDWENGLDVATFENSSGYHNQGCQHCTDNSPGSFECPTKSSECSPYPGEFYNSISGMCEACPAGTYTDDTDQRHCDVCKGGSMSSSYSSSCYCEAGSYYFDVDGNAFDRCEKCPADTYDSNDGYGRIYPYYRGIYGDSSTYNFIAYDLSSICEPCQGAVEGSHQCDLCFAGEFLNRASQSCELCPSNTYTDGMDFRPFSCNACPPGFTSGIGATECQPYTYDASNSNDMEACIAVHGSDAGCGGQFICDSVTYLPCPNMDGPLVDGSVRSINFISGALQEISIQPGVGEAVLRVDNVPLTYVARVTVPTDQPLKQLSIMSTTNVCFDEYIMQGFKLVYGTSADATTALLMVFLPRNPDPMEGDFYVCVAEMDGKLTRSQLADPSNMWLASVDSAANVFVNYNTSRSVIPKDERLFYRFSVQGFSSQNYEDGTAFIFDVVDIEHNDTDFDPYACHTDVTQAAGNIISSGGCSITVEPDSEINGGVTSLVYKMPRSRYAECAADLYVEDGQPVVFNGRLDLPAPGASGLCHYFQEYDYTRNYQISMERNLITELGESTTNDISSFYRNITKVLIQPCEGSGMDYHTPMARFVFDLLVKYTGTRSSDTLGTGTLHPGGYAINDVDGIINTCNNIAKTCNYRLESTKCERLYQYVDSGNQEEKCVFNSDLFLNYHATFTETLDSGLSITHPLRVPTMAQGLTFARSACYKPLDTSVEDVSDKYAVSLAALNHDPNGMDWTTAASNSLVWDAPLVIRLAVDDLSSRAEVQITDVTFKVTEIATGNAVGQSEYTLSRSEKLRTMGGPSTSYYNDAHFCRYYDSNSLDSNKCTAFYESLFGTPFRWNNYMESVKDNLPSKFHCTADPSSIINEHNSDYFTFSLGNWVLTKPFDVPIRVEASVTGTIEACQPTTVRQDAGKAEQIIKQTVTFEFGTNGDTGAGSVTAPAIAAVVSTIFATMMAADLAY